MSEHSKKLLAVLNGGELGMWTERKWPFGDRWKNILEWADSLGGSMDLLEIDTDALRELGQEGGGWCLGTGAIPNHPLKVVCRYAIGENLETTMEWIVGTPEKVDEHLSSWLQAYHGKIDAEEYQTRTGILLGYPYDEVKTFARDNKDGATCSCSQCIPTSARNEWWADVPLVDLRTVPREHLVRGWV